MLQLNYYTNTKDPTVLCPTRTETFAQVRVEKSFSWRAGAATSGGFGEMARAYDVTQAWSFPLRTGPLAFLSPSFRPSVSPLVFPGKHCHGLSGPGGPMTSVLGVTFLRR